MSTNIEWTDETWNIIVGCSRISSGCQQCYAATAAKSPRLQQFPQYQAVSLWDGTVQFVSSGLIKATKLLQSKNLIKTATYKFGNSPIKHIRIDWENFLNELQAVVQAPPNAPERIKTTFARSDQNGNLTKCQSPSLQNGELELNKMSNLKLTFCELKAENKSKF
jgi:protein gp37